MLEWVALSLVKHLGGKTFRNLLAHFDDDLNAILRAEVVELRRVPGIGQKIAESIRAIDLDSVAVRLDHWQENGIQVITSHDPHYPERLRHIDDAPPTLFLRGDVKALSPAKSVAVVGTRSPTQLAETHIQAIIRKATGKNTTVVSGLALGVDYMAHFTTIADGGRTIAVLGNGLMTVYPAQHRNIARAILTQGAVICEVAPDAAVSAPGLVARNRLITGLSDAVIVVETAVDGGAMHAARFARLQNRPLYTLDLPATGNRELIDSGATVLDSDALDRIF